MTKIFKTKEELLAQAEKDWVFDACGDDGEGLNWVMNQETLEDIIANISQGYRFLFLCEGYEQFAELYDWNYPEGYSLAHLLAKQPHFAKYCDWSKLDGYDWGYLLKKQPHLIKYKEVKQ